MSSHITYDELKKITYWAIFNRNVKGIGCDTSDLDHYKIKSAIHEGIYIGSPGKDIYYMLPYLSDIQMKELVEIISVNFPSIPPINHVNIAAFIRFIYGQFEKQGTLKSDKDFKKMKEEKPAWELSRKFIKYLYDKFLEIGNYYGLCILCEMEGHRLGDEALIHNDKGKLKEMEKIYNLSVEFANKCKSWKQLFTPYFWSSMYFIKWGDIENSVRYCKLTVYNAEKYCPDSRDSYIEKVEKCLEYIRKNNKEEWKKISKENFKNKCVKKAIKKLK